MNTFKKVLYGKQQLFELFRFTRVKHILFFAVIVTLCLTSCKKKWDCKCGCYTCTTRIVEVKSQTREEAVQLCKEIPTINYEACEIAE